MPGGYDSPRQQRRRARSDPSRATLAERAGLAEPEAVEQAPRPCWVALTAERPVPGHVLAWHHEPEQGWVAAVLVHLPAAAVVPRDAGE